MLTKDEWPVYRMLRLRSLADSPDAFARTVAEEERLPGEYWQSRLIAAAASPRDYPLIAELDGQAVGLTWAKVDADDASVVNFYQVWVAPEARGRGIAAALLQTAIDWSASRGARLARLGVTWGDTPATRLYHRLGFLPVGELEPLREGSPILSQTMELTLTR
ncbi:MAG TPA: GNAT family N-acetyltransferase [Telluria sp.]|nr:GNAT family N-acetyltransferase [Telluria sp.]